MITRTCKQCGNEYRTFPSINLYFCSAKCSNIGKRKGTAEKCAQCGKEFWKFPSRKIGKYCSRSCATTARNLTETNPSFHRDITGENNPMFGKAGCVGEKNGMFGMTGDKCPRWKGGRKLRPDGYVRVLAPIDHPYPCENHRGVKYILEHRLVMEKHIGRYLSPTEVIHHIDGDPSNNSIDNLELFDSQVEHSTFHQQKKRETIL